MCALPQPDRLLIRLCTQHATLLLVCYIVGSPCMSVATETFTAQSSFTIWVYCMQAETFSLQIQEHNHPNQEVSDLQHSC